MPTHARVLATVALGLALLACGGRERTAEPAGARTVVEVENQTTLDMNIYAVREGVQRVRLGTARAHGTSRFVLPSGFVTGSTQLRIEADPIGSSAVSVSEDIVIRPGETVGVTIPPGAERR